VILLRRQLANHPPRTLPSPSFVPLSSGP